METERQNVYAFEHGLSPATAKLVDLLKLGNVGDFLTDERMTGHCGRDTSVHGTGYGNLQTAIGRVERFHSLVWRRVTGAGSIKCLNDEEKAALGNSSIGKIKRESSRTDRVLSLVEMANLSEDGQKKYLVGCTQIRTIAMMSKPATSKKLLVRGVTKSPDLDKLLEAFEKIV